MFIFSFETKHFFAERVIGLMLARHGLGISVGFQHACVHAYKWLTIAGFAAEDGVGGCRKAILEHPFALGVRSGQVRLC